MKVGCYIKSARYDQPGLRQHVEKYGDQFSRIIEIKTDSTGCWVTLQFWTKEITISMEDLKQDWVID